MTIHIAHLVTSFDTGGLQSGIVNIINGADRSRFRHSVLSMTSRTSLGERLSNGDVINLGFDGGRYLTAFRQIARSLRAIGADILHTRNWGTYPDGILAAGLSGVRGRIHGHHGRDLKNADGEVWRRRLLGGVLSRFTDRIIALTPSMRQEYVRDFGVAPEKIRVIPNGIDVDRFDLVGAKASTGDVFTIVSVGRLDPVKDLSGLIEAFARMPGRGPGDRLLIAGEGPDRPIIERHAAALDVSRSVQLLGERRDVPEIMKSADIYVQPSIYEGMSNTIVEAMALERCIVCTDAGGNADVVGREGAAVLVPRRDPMALAAALSRLKADAELRRRMGRSARLRAIELFGLPRMVDAYQSLYEEVAASHRPRNRRKNG